MEFFESLHAYTDDADHTVFAGDYNMVENITLDRSPPSINKQHQQGIQELNTFKQRFLLQDKWRHDKPNEKHFTWISRKRDENIKSRIDRIYLSNKIVLINIEYI